MGTARTAPVAISIAFVHTFAVSFALTACTSDTIEPELPPPNADPLLGCSIDCHGDDISNAPPKSMSGATATTDVAIGAHRAHLNVAATWHRQVACSDCHVVPAEVGAPGHLDGDGKAEVTFAMIAGAGATWNGTTCTTRCHGSTMIGGAQPTPAWTRVDGSQATCGSCHGVAPPAPHPASAAAACASCHPTMEEGSATFRDPQSHINGVIDVTAPGATGGCTTCHGSTSSSAPPKDLGGNTAATARGVGAHAAHLKPSTWHRAMPCTSCHVVPITLDAPGHRDGDNVAEVKFDTLNPAATYTAGTTTCASLYCHGNGRGNTGTASWVTPGALACTSCHSINGTNMSGDHRRHIGEENMRCSQCHATVVDANRNIINANLHVNGLHEVKMANGTYNATTRACSNTGCHNTKIW
ncbi:MAG TPA: CxxxxCH/CxxCH domain-containing protein [Kofleriaceae bacterium]|nr:CxxxxCH/CxxCH domain-containing protein [Kofleriaceae bacterium]